MKIFSIFTRNLAKIFQTFSDQLTKIPKRSVTPLIAVLLLTGTVSLGTACDDDKDYSRREHIEWSNSPEF